ncbi:hypothetical protein [Absidia glauca]|uniref:Uncharacterized protein n=1 Tax=Absidia glauca TaxID=4829 RepID=A0A168PPG3_ABSGL|nr:hypothetical protein [Absidia glauca]
MHSYNAPFKGTPLAKLKSFNGPVTFGLDELHLLGHGLCKEVLAMAKIVKKLFVDMEHSLRSIPTTFDGSFRTPNSKHTTRAVDYLAIVTYAIPALFVNEMVNGEAKHALKSIVKFLQLAQLRSISDQQLDDMDRYLQAWNDFLQAQVDDNKYDITVFKPNYHYLQHITAMIRQLGPMYAFSTRCLERTIGMYKRKLKSTKDSGVEAGNVLVSTAATDYAKSMQDEDNADDNEGNDEGIYLDGKTNTIRLSSASIDQLGIDREEVYRTLGATRNSIIITATRIFKDGTIYGSKSNTTRSTRKDYLMVFNTVVNKYALRPRRQPSNVLMFFFGDVLKYIKYDNNYFAVVTLYQAYFDDDNETYYFRHTQTRTKTTLINANDLLACAGTISNSRSKCSSIFWDQMVLGQDTSAANCGNLDYVP